MLITAFNPPEHFQDSQVRGAFGRFTHDHFFTALSEKSTLMRDEFDYQSPFGWIGVLADRIFLQSYMRSFLEKRNRLIKLEAEKGD